MRSFQVLPNSNNDGYDINDPATRGLIEQGQKQFRPRFLLLGFPCRWWNILDENANYSHRMDELWLLRDEERPLLDWAVGRCLEQAQNGNFYFLENPLRSRLWDEPSVQQLSRDPDNHVVILDGGAFGAKDFEGYVILKTFKVYTNSAKLARQLNRRLSPRIANFVDLWKGEE